MSVYDLSVNASSLHHPRDAESDTLPARCQRAFTQRFDEWKYRRSLAKMLDIEDVLLEDMGTNRGELIAAMDLPLKQSARDALAQWRAERRITG